MERPCRQLSGYFILILNRVAIDSIAWNRQFGNVGSRYGPCTWRCEVGNALPSAHCLVGERNSMMEPEFVQDTLDEIEDLSTLYKIVTRSMLIRAISEAGGVSE